MIDIFCEQGMLRYSSSKWITEDDIHVRRERYFGRILLECPITLHTYFSEESKNTINVFILCINRLDSLPIELVLKIKNYMGEDNYLVINDNNNKDSMFTRNVMDGIYSCNSMFTRMDGIYLPKVDGWTFPRKYGLDLINSSGCNEIGHYRPLTNQFEEITRRMIAAGVSHP